MLDLAPNSAHAATITAKIIPNTIIILSFLYINLLSLSTSSLPHLISIREASLEASYGCLSKLAYLPRLIFLFTFTTSAKRAATTANVIPNIIIMLPFLYFNYSLFNLFECKDNAFLCAYTFFGKKMLSRVWFLDFRQKLSCQLEQNGRFFKNKSVSKLQFQGELYITMITFFPIYLVVLIYRS